jgi:hypothetical protein
MIDTFGLAVTHGLLLLVAWRLIFRPDLDDAKASQPDPQAKAQSRLKLWKGGAGA